MLGIAWAGMPEQQMVEEDVNVIVNIDQAGILETIQKLIETQGGWVVALLIVAGVVCFGLWVKYKGKK